jgi:pseudouridine synthase
MTPSSAVRLNRFLSMAGAASRRKADELIAAGRVTVNGKTVRDLGVKVDPPADAVFLDGKQVVVFARKTYILLNKPKDTITTLSDERGRHSVRDLVDAGRRVFPVGRLDRNTTGVLILTDDGEFANALMHPRNKVAKTYLVTPDRAVPPEDLRKLASGIRLADGRTGPADVRSIPGAKNPAVEITIREGRNRQVHRMFAALGYEVRKLERVAYGTVTCRGLPRGAWRHLTPPEVRALLSESGAGGTGGSKRPRGGAHGI